MNYGVQFRRFQAIFEEYLKSRFSVCDISNDLLELVLRTGVTCPIQALPNMIKAAVRSHQLENNQENLDFDSFLDQLIEKHQPQKLATIMPTVFEAFESLENSDLEPQILKFIAQIPSPVKSPTTTSIFVEKFISKIYLKTPTVTTACVNYIVQVFQNIDTILLAAGPGFAAVCRLTIELLASVSSEGLKRLFRPVTKAVIKCHQRRLSAGAVHRVTVDVENLELELCQTCFLSS